MSSAARDMIELLVANLVQVELSHEEPGTFAVVLHGLIIRDGLNHGQATAGAAEARNLIRAALRTSIFLLKGPA